MNDLWNDRLSEYLDGDLAAHERAALEEHLLTCETCRADLVGLRLVVERARPLRDAAVPPAARKRVRLPS